MLHFDLVSILFGTSIPTSFNILVKMFLHLFIICHNVVLPDLVFLRLSLYLPLHSMCVFHSHVVPESYKSEFLPSSKNFTSMPFQSELSESLPY